MRLPPGARWRARIPPAAGDREPVPAVLLAAPGCRNAQCRRQQRRQQFKRSISAAPSGPTSASATTPNAVTQRSSRDAMCSIAALPGCARRDHISPAAASTSRHRPGGDHRRRTSAGPDAAGASIRWPGRPRAPRRPATARIQAEARASCSNWARSWSTAAPRASWMRSGKTARSAARSMFQPWRRAGSARSGRRSAPRRATPRVLGAQLAPTASRPMLACP